MTDEQFQRARALFLEACDLAPSERAGFLDEQCEDDEIRRAVDQWLADDGRSHALDRGVDVPPTVAGAFEQVTSLSTSASFQLDPGDRVGNYLIREKIGEGGFAYVYAAEQEKPVRRRVALKIIKPGMDSRQVIARFEAERQALAMMDHPNVARVFDAGTTDAGRPYFVMEYVAGVSLTEHCDRQRMRIDERLRLLVQVCRAVQHAHQKGIIHRDIKPSNVLVVMSDGAHAPKVIDFGVAKALHQKLAEQTIFTEQGQLIGTLEYMSPEQAEMTAQDIDTRSDTYALGVLLYELLTGTLPFAPSTLREAGFGEIQRIIREEEAPRASTRLSSLSADELKTRAHQRAVDPGALERALSGDLDWIVAKCLEKDRTRRYETVSALAMDIERHLGHQPVLAGPPGGMYQVRKFVRRNRLGVGVASAAVIVIVAAIALISIALGREGTLRRETQLQAEIAEAINDFLNDDLLAAVAPSASSGRGIDVTMREVLDEAANRIEAASEPGGRLADKPLVEAAIRLTLGETYRRLALDARAIPHLKRSRDLHERHLGGSHPDTLEAMSSLALTYMAQGRFRDAVPLHRSTLALRREVLGDDNPDTLTSMSALASVYWHQRRLGLAKPLYEEALERRRRTLGEEHADTLSSMTEVAALHVRQAVGTRRALRRQPDLESLFARQTRDCEERCREVMEICVRELGADDPITLEAIHLRACAHGLAGRNDEAVRLFEQALETRERILDEEHPDTLRSMEQLVMVYRALRRHAEAGPLSDELRSRRRNRAYRENASPMDKNQQAWALYLLHERATPKDAAEALRLSLEMTSATNDRNASLLDTLAAVYAMNGDHAKAIETLKKAMALLDADETDFHIHMEDQLAKFEQALAR